MATPGSFTTLSATTLGNLRTLATVQPTQRTFGLPPVGTSFDFSTGAFTLPGTTVPSIGTFNPLVVPLPGSEPLGGGVVPGIIDTIGAGIDIAERIFGLFGGGDPVTNPIVATGDLGTGPCPGLLSVRGPDGTCINLEDLAPGGAPAVTGRATQVGTSLQFGTPVNGRFGVGILPRVEAQTIRRCPKGMALGKDGVCYDGLSRNSPKREWPMGMKPLLTPGERNAIRIAGRAAGKLSRSQKTLKKTARALAKVC